MNLTLFGVTLTSERLRVLAALFFAAITAYQLTQAPWNELSNYFDLRQKIAQQEAQIQSAQNIPLTRSQILRRRKDVDRQILALRSKFPPRSQVVSILLVDLSKIFAQSGVRLESFQPSDFEPLTEGGVQDLGRFHISIRAQGEYASFISLFDKLARYGSAVTVGSPKIVPMGGGSSSDSGTGGDQGAAGSEPFAPQTGLNRTLEVNFALSTFALNQ